MKMSPRFNGVVSVMGHPVKVVEGIAHFNGQVYFVSDDGSMVTDQNRGLVGILHKGQFMPATPEIIDQLSGKGLFEHEQPENMAPQAPQ